jgi:diaminopimelate decarboxylase
MSISGLAGSTWSRNSAGELLVGALSVCALAERYGTPLFLYDHRIVRRQYWALRNALPDRVSISYSVKANPSPIFLRFFLDQRCGLEIASIGEFHLAIAAGCAPKDILFAGPGKTVAELEVAITHSIGEIHAESRLEVDRISTISRRLNVPAQIALRINPCEEGQGGAMRMGGKAAPFGIDEEQMEPLVERVVRDPYLNFCGVHLFSGTQILDHNVLLTQYKKAVEIARRVALLTNAPLTTVDFGGGLGVPYFPGETTLDLDPLKSGLAQLMTEIENDPYFAHTRFIVEPGRFLVAEAGIYVARINDIKVSRGKTFVILDGGMNHHLAASGNLGQVIRRNFPMAIVNRCCSPCAEPVDVVGPLCTPLDTLGRSIQIGSAEVGDLVAIFCSGAYARSASPLGFLSHPTPPEVWVEEGQDHLARRRGTSDDLTRDAEVAGDFQSVS